MIVEPGEFYSDAEPALQQGDIVLAPVGRLETPPIPTTPSPGALAAWQSLDSLVVELDDGSQTLPKLQLAGGYTPAMVVTHDCHMDKEFLARYRELRSGQRLTKDQAQQQAEADRDLDRFVAMSPLLAIDELRPNPESLRAAAVIGLFAVPLHDDFPESAIDLTYITTVDRHAIVHRYAVLSEAARTALRFALARSCALRTPQIGFELEEAVERRIHGVRRSQRDPSMVRLELSDGSELELLMQPAAPDTGGPARSTSPAAQGQGEA
jgi:hypothetical protein